MSASVTLSTEEQVTFKPLFTHGMDTVYWKVREQGTQDGKVPSYVAKAAVDAVLPLAIESVLRAGSEPFKATQEWLDQLTVDDYDKIVSPLIDMMNDTIRRIEEGK